MYVLEHSIPSSNGRNFSFWWTGTSIFGMTVVITNLKMLLISNTWNIVGVFFLVGSLIVYLITLFIVMMSKTSHLFSVVPM
jgi:Zn-dependent protease with chaperone function